MPTGFKAINDELGWPSGEPHLDEVVHVECGWRTGWQLFVECERAEGNLWAIFEDPISYRVHDERELLPYWQTIKEEGAPVVACYEIADSTYLAELRHGVSAMTDIPMRHIILTSQNICVEVVTSTLPTISTVAPEPVESLEAWEQLRAARTSSAIKQARDEPTT